MKLSPFIIALFLACPSPAYANHDDDGDCRGGGCGTQHRHDGDTCISPCSITIIVPPEQQKPQSIGCLIPFPYHCDPEPQ